jgi:hypothetical protein
MTRAGSRFRNPSTRTNNVDTIGKGFSDLSLETNHRIIVSYVVRLSDLAADF